MLKFNFHLERPQNCIILPNFVFEKKLNDEWKMIFNWNPVPAAAPIPQFLEIRRETGSEETLVTGTLTHKAIGQIIKVEEIFKLFGKGTLSVKMDLFEIPPVYENRMMDVVIYIAPTSAVANGGCKKYTKEMALENLSNDFGKLLDPENSWYSDVSLKCGDVLVPAHKIILSTRSPVFAAMFVNEMRENNERHVNITDMDADIVRDMVIFIYTGKTPSLTIMTATHLLYAAEKYQLQDLKRVCTDFLKENVSILNVLTFIDLGNALSDDLKYFAIEYFCKTCDNFLDFEGSEEWTNFRRQRPDLAMDVMASLLKFRDRQGPHVF